MSTQGAAGAPCFTLHLASDCVWMVRLAGCGSYLLDAGVDSSAGSGRSAPPAYGRPKTGRPEIKMACRRLAPSKVTSLLGGRTLEREDCISKSPFTPKLIVGPNYVQYSVIVNRFVQILYSLKVRRTLRPAHLRCPSAPRTAPARVPAARAHATTPRAPAHAARHRRRPPGCTGWRSRRTRSGW
jgi:hypothetical protein